MNLQATAQVPQLADEITLTSGRYRPARMAFTRHANSELAVNYLERRDRYFATRRSDGPSRRSCSAQSCRDSGTVNASINGPMLAAYCRLPLMPAVPADTIVVLPHVTHRPDGRQCSRRRTGNLIVPRIACAGRGWPCGKPPS